MASRSVLMHAYSVRRPLPPTFRFVLLVLYLVTSCARRWVLRRCLPFNFAHRKRLAQQASKTRRMVLCSLRLASQVTLVGLARDQPMEKGANPSRQDSTSVPDPISAQIGGLDIWFSLRVPSGFTLLLAGSGVVPECQGFLSVQKFP